MEATVAARSTFVPVIEEAIDERARFIRRAYAHLAFSVLAFIVVEAIFLNTPWIVSVGISMSQGWTWLLALGGFMFVTSIADKWALESSDKTSQYVALASYVVAEAFIFVPIIYLAIAVTGDLSFVRQAAFLAMCLFTGLSAVVLLSRKDFSMLRTAVSVGGLVGLGLIVTGTLFGFSLGLWFSFSMIGVATGSILYQTSRILHEYHTQQYVAASLGLFGSFMLVLWHVLNIFSSLSDD